MPRTSAANCALKRARRIMLASPNRGFCGP
jgi:hypothetical protein